MDNQLSPYIAEQLRVQGYDAVHVTAIGMGEAQDKDILAFAERENRIVITADNDFPRLMAILRKRQPSIILIKLMQFQKPSDQAQVLIEEMEQWLSELSLGCIITVSRQNTRIRRLPIYPPYED